MATFTRFFIYCSIDQDDVDLNICPAVVVETDSEIDEQVSALSAEGWPFIWVDEVEVKLVNRLLTRQIMDFSHDAE